MTDTMKMEAILAKVNSRVEQERQEFASEEPIIHSQFNSSDVLKALKSNEDGDAWLFTELHRELFCFDHAAGCFYEWNGNYWVADNIMQATAAIEQVVDVYGTEVQRQVWLRLKAERSGDQNSAMVHQKNEEALIARIRQIQTASRKRNILHLATVGRGSLGITGDEWDLDPWCLPTINAVIDLKTGNSRPGQQSDYFKTVCPTIWKGIETPCPTWEQYLFQIFDSDGEIRSFVQRLLGYACTGTTNDHVFPVLWGQRGRNGKGTLLEVLGHVLGPLAGTVSSEVLLDQGRPRNPGSPTPEIMAFRGKRIVWASETSEGRRVNTGQVKRLCGGDTLEARDPYGRRQINFRPTHTLFLLTNSKPIIPAEDSALWERVCLIPFNLSFVDEPRAKSHRKRDPQLPHKLKEEASGILAWLVRGCLEWQTAGYINPPAKIKGEKVEYQASQDTIAAFIEERCVTGTSCKVKGAHLYKNYRGWCESNILRPMNGTRFGQEMKKRFDCVKSNGIHYIGLGVLDQ